MMATFLSFLLTTILMALKAGATIEWISRPYSRLFVNAGNTAKIDWKFPPGAKAVIYEYKTSNTLKRGERIANVFGNSPTDIMKSYKGKVDIDASGALRILNAGVADEGFYSITITYKLTALTDEVEIKIQKAPAIISFPSHPKGKVFYRGIGIKLVCMAVGRPVPEVSWYKDDIKVPLEKSKGSIIYKIKSASDDDTGKYTCLANNKAGKANRTIDFVIYRRPYDIDFVHDTALDGTIFEGQSVTFTCSAKGSPPITTYKLLHNGRKLTETPNGLYKISEVRLKHSGKYCCIPINKAGLGQNMSVILRVQERPGYWKNRLTKTSKVKTATLPVTTRKDSTQAGITEIVVGPSGPKENQRGNGCVSNPSLLLVTLPIALTAWIMRW